MKKAVAMPCTEAQFEAMRPKLETIEGLRIESIGDWEVSPCLVNSFCGQENVITNIDGYTEDWYNRTVYPEFNEQIFLEACGYQTAEAKLDDLISRMLDELSERIARLEGVMTGQVEDAKPEIDYSRIKTGSRVKVKGEGDKTFRVVLWDADYYIDSFYNRYKKKIRDFRYFTFYDGNDFYFECISKNDKIDFITEVIQY